MAIEVNVIKNGITDRSGMKPAELYESLKNEEKDEYLRYIVNLELLSCNDFENTYLSCRDLYDDTINAIVKLICERRLYKSSPKTEILTRLIEIYALIMDNDSPTYDKRPRLSKFDTILAIVEKYAKR